MPRVFVAKTDVDFRFGLLKLMNFPIPSNEFNRQEGRLSFNGGIDIIVHLQK